MTREEDQEDKRIEQTRLGTHHWRKWGPYLSERQWGTVREDYSANGDAWNYLPHDHARSRAYRWGEDGIAGISDQKMRLCFALAFWNGADPILKERLFGLTNQEGNHGEDVKEYYFYLDNVPSHAYMKYLYKYPQKAFPYTDLVATNGRRNRFEFEYELLDTKIFDDDRYFDITIEYAKADDEDIVIRIAACNRGKEAALLDILPTLWFRNTWSWETGCEKPNITAMQGALQAQHPQLGTYWLSYEPADELLFTENETNKMRLFGVPNNTPYVKDGINDYVVQGKKECVNPHKQGTKAAIRYGKRVEAGATATVQLRLSSKQPSVATSFADSDKLFAARIQETALFYNKIAPQGATEEMKHIQKVAYSGLLWNKQCYCYSVEKWLKGDPAGPPPPYEHTVGRNHKWWHLDACDIFCMPDKWEYPWFASWDLSFHALVLARIDPECAKAQLLMITNEWYMHPNGQIPAYEWSFGDVNPPVQAWAAWRVYQTESRFFGRKDRSFLEKIFHKLILNFTWWASCKDAGGRNIFEGGFLGLDNIAAINRSTAFSDGNILEQPDGTGWMGMYCLVLLQMALELAHDDHNFEALAMKFLEHFIKIADAINHITDWTSGLWNEEEGFYYSLIEFEDGSTSMLKQDTMVGLVPLFAVLVHEPNIFLAFPKFRQRFEWLVSHRGDLLKDIGDISSLPVDGRVLLSIVNPEKLKRILEKVLDEEQFLGQCGVRSVSRVHDKAPFTFTFNGRTSRLDYEPAESMTGLFGGNSNWRGPIWFPLNYLLIETLRSFYEFLGDQFTVEYPVRSGKQKTLKEVADDLSRRLISIFLPDRNGRRPLYGGIQKFQSDPYWKDLLFFHEYFHGDNGAGLGASNQTGWTALVATLIENVGDEFLA